MSGRAPFVRLHLVRREKQVKSAEAHVALDRGRVRLALHFFVLNFAY